MNRRTLTSTFSRFCCSRALTTLAFRSVHSPAAPELTQNPKTKPVSGARPRQLAVTGAGQPADCKAFPAANSVTA